MHETYINTNPKAINDKLVKSGTYKDHQYYVKKVKLGDYQWFCGYIEILSTDNQYKKIITEGNKTLLDTISITFNGHIYLDNNLLKGYYIGFDTQDGFLRFLTTSQCVELIKDTVNNDL